MSDLRNISPLIVCLRCNNYHPEERAITTSQDPQREKLNAELKILVVEDRVADYELIQYALIKGGLNVHSACVDSSDELKKQLSSQPWDLIISDHRLPGFDSTQVFQLVKDIAPSIPVIVVSGQMGEELAVRAMQNGADDYVMKDNLTRLAPAVQRSVLSAKDKQLRRAAEQAKQEAQDKLNRIAANLPGAIFQLSNTGTDYQFNYISSACVGLINQAPNQLIENFFLFKQAIFEQDLPRLFDTLEQSIVDGKSVCCQGRIKQDKCYPQQWLQLNAQLHTCHDGNPVWDGTLIDISAQKFAEQQLQDTREEIRRITAELHRRTEQERANIAREIHDDIGGTLTKLKTDIAWIQKKQLSQQQLAERLASMNGLLDAIVQSTQAIALNLRPAILDYGIVPAIEWQLYDLKKRTGINTHFSYNQEHIHLSADQSTALFRIVQEALTNVTKHAQATLVRVDLFTDEESISLEVCDNGIGIQSETEFNKNAFGLRGVKERVIALNGWVEFNSHPSYGTTIMISMPKQSHEETYP